jgi:tetratricopeptide (TPR) repeat protein
MSRATPKRKRPPRPRDPDDDVLALMRYLNLADPEWLRAQIGAAFKVAALPARRERRAAALRDPRWRSPAKVELLTILAEEELGRPATSAALAALAAAAAARVWPSALTSGDDLRPRALLMLARACRHCGHYREAERALGAAARRWHDPDDAVERGLFLAELGKLRWEQGRLEEAAALFDHTPKVIGERRHGSFLHGAVQLLGAHVYLELRQVERAAERLALCDLDSGRFPSLARRALLASELCLALASGRAGAGGSSGSLPPPLPPVPERGEALWQDWMLGRIAAAGGRLEAAQRTLEAVRRDLLGAGSLREAASVALDLAEVRAKSGRPPGFAELGEELARSFPRVSAAVVAGFRALAEEALGAGELRRRTVVLLRRLASLPRRTRSRPDLICHLARLVDLASIAPESRKPPRFYVN